MSKVWKFSQFVHLESLVRLKDALQGRLFVSRDRNSYFIAFREEALPDAKAAAQERELTFQEVDGVPGGSVFLNFEATPDVVDEGSESLFDLLD